MARHRIAAALVVLAVLSATPAAGKRDGQIEKKIIDRISTADFQTAFQDRRCRDEDRYRVYLIDNFEQAIEIVPGVRTSHGELLVRLLQSGRTDLDVTAISTTLGRGLARVIDDLLRGGCADAVLSSIPGSNYTYDQAASLLNTPVKLGRENILYHRGALRALMRQIAFHGFPSVRWLENIDVNSVKLAEDARKFVLIEALGRFNVPVILPYGNEDSHYRGQARSVNLLSMAGNAKVFSALGRDGERVPGFPYSPLSSGDELAVYPIVECRDPQNPAMAHLDINGDGHFEYTFLRAADDVADPDGSGEVSPQGSAARPAGTNTTGQDRFREPGELCRERGSIRGTSLIPPGKVRELLPPR